MLDSIYHMTFKLFCNNVFWCENAKMLPNISDVFMGVIS